MRLVNGIEMTAVDAGRDVHVLGYFFAADDGDVQIAFSRCSALARIERVREIAGRLQALELRHRRRRAPGGDPGRQRPERRPSARRRRARRGRPRRRSSRRVRPPARQRSAGVRPALRPRRGAGRRGHRRGRRHRVARASGAPRASTIGSRGTPRAASRRSRCGIAITARRTKHATAGWPPHSTSPCRAARTSMARARGARRRWGRLDSRRGDARGRGLRRARGARPARPRRRTMRSARRRTRTRDARPPIERHSQALPEPAAASPARS